MNNDGMIDGVQLRVPTTSLLDRLGELFALSDDEHADQSLSLAKQILTKIDFSKIPPPFVYLIYDIVRAEWCNDRLEVVAEFLIDGQGKDTMILSGAVQTSPYFDYTVYVGDTFVVAKESKWIDCDAGGKRITDFVLSVVAKFKEESSKLIEKE